MQRVVIYFKIPSSNNSASHQIGGIRICCDMDSEIYNSTISDNNSNNASGNGISLVGGEGSLILKNSILVERW